MDSKFRICLSLLLSLVLSQTASAQEQQPPGGKDEEKYEELTGMSLEDLTDVEFVVSASKYEQPIDRSPMAIDILTADEIQRSGAKTIADLLKRFPGVWTWSGSRSSAAADRPSTEPMRSPA